MLAAAAFLLMACRAATPEPDVIVVTLDTTRADHLGPYGYPREVSPFLDDFARESIVYRRAWSTSPWTLPAHASLLTGKYPKHHGAHYAAGGEAALGDVVPRDRLAAFRVQRLGEEQRTLAELLVERGYATGVFAGGPWLTPPFGLLQGYQHQVAEARDLKGRTAQELTDAAIAWIEGLPRSRPLHLLINYFDPHTPYRPPAAFLRDVAGSGSDTPDERTLYDAEIRFVDQQLGRLFAALRRSGRYDGALIVVTADHGELFGEHGLKRHGYWLYEELLRIPFIMRLPGARAGGSQVETPVSLVDVLPIVASELGLSLPADVDGAVTDPGRILLAASFRNPAVEEVQGRRVDRDLFMAIRWPWKLIVDDRGGRELFRLDSDSREGLSLTGSAEEEGLLAELRAAREALGAPAAPRLPAGVDAATADRLRELGYLE